MVRETPEIYHRIVRPYIDAFPPARTQWSVPPVLPSSVVTPPPQI